MQTIDDILPKLSNVKVMSTIDMRQAFWMLRLDRASSLLTTFETPFGRFVWRRLPMGLNVSPELFAARIQAALSGLEGVYCIADDLLITGKGADMVAATRDHNDNLVQLFERCRQQGIKLNRDKFKFNRQTVTFMGHDLTPEGIKPSQSKIDAIQQMPIPEDKAAVQ